MIRTILHLSDTHGLHLQLGTLPNADVLVHSGDFTTDGTEKEVFDFTEWFCRQPHPYKIFIAGNHDTTKTVWKDCQTMYTTFTILPLK